MAASPGRAARQGADFFSLDRTRAALLIIDMQNGFIAEGAALEVPTGRDIIPNIERLIAVCRRQEIPIIWVQLDSNDPDDGMLLRKYPSLKAQQTLFQGTESFELFGGLSQPREGDQRVIKHKYDSFHETHLESMLESIDADTLILCGVTTNCCCESTARSAFERNFKVAFVADATAAYTPELHNASLTVIDELFGRVIDTSSAVSELTE